ncbi:SigE family RNA polymerase sigma factor [Nocardioides sp. SYSU DS0663]|uniref:SigE family RNA polymerase sigma factor n=1 Tax=Nocardioides sp. SYSU DS0663 TaxID=3416445 RepID=UPI003F4C7ACD
MQITTEAGADTGAMGGGASRDAEFTEWLAVRQPALLRTAYLLAGDRHAAEDLLQTSLAKLYLSWDRVRDREAVDAYARRIMVNENTSLWRRPWRRREHVSDDVPEPPPWTDRYDDGSDGVLWELVQSLPRRARAVVVLRYYEQLTEAETAEVLGISVGTVKSQCSRALATLRARVPAAIDPTIQEDER